MNKKIIKYFFITVLLFFSAQAYSQKGGDYQNAVGLSVDFGTGITGAGIGFKHFFNDNDAVEAGLVFFNNTPALGAYYQYNGEIENADGLKWYFGMGPQFFFGKGATDIAARAMAGLDFRIPNVPLNISFDWRPYFRFNHGSEFIAARFGLGVRFAF